MTKSQKFLLQLLEMTRDCHIHNSKNRKPDGWFYQGPADLLLREGQWYPTGRVKKWAHSQPQACFRNAALFAMDHRLPYVEGYATSIIPVHHAWCLDHDGRVLELTWKELGTDYYGVEFSPKLVLKGAVLFHEPNARIYKRKLNSKGPGQTKTCSAR